MEEVTSAVSQMATLLVITAVGFLATKLGYLDEGVKDKITALLLNITLPCMIVASAGNLESGQLEDRVILIFCLGVFQFLLLLIVACLFNGVFRVSRDQRSLYCFMSVCTNTGFIGIPIADALYGSESVLLCSVFIMVMSVLLYSVGVSILISGQKYDSGQGKCDSEGASDAARASSVSSGIDVRKIVRAIFNPMTGGALLALVLVFAHLSLPPVIQHSCELIGSITAPLAMMMVGVIIAHTKIASVVTEWRLYPYIILRQLVAPAVLFLILRMIVSDPIVLGIFTVMFAMPVGTMTPMFCASYGRDALLPAKGTILSTLASFIVIPLLILFMLMV